MSDYIDILKIMGKLICVSVTIHKWHEKMGIFTIFYVFYGVRRYFHPHDIFTLGWKYPYDIFTPSTIFSPPHYKYWKKFLFWDIFKLYNVPLK